MADESLSALSTIRSFAAEELMFDLYSQKLGAFYAHRRAQASVYVFFFILSYQVQRSVNMTAFAPIPGLPLLMTSHSTHSPGTPRNARVLAMG